MSYPIGGHPPKPVTAQAVKKKEEKPSCPCFGRKVTKRIQHEKALTQHEIDFANLMRKDAFEEEKNK